VQTGYLLAFRSLASFRGEGSFKTWIARIVMNSCFLHIREARRRVGIEEQNGMELKGRASITGANAGEVRLVSGTLLCVFRSFG
jgi:DNA-directed RNA polymerase specialized sigma24 family protein